jgi:hypothetical protein
VMGLRRSRRTTAGRRPRPASATARAAEDFGAVVGAFREVSPMTAPFRHFFPPRTPVGMAGLRGPTARLDAD